VGRLEGENGVREKPHGKKTKVHFSRGAIDADPRIDRGGGGGKVGRASEKNQNQTKSLTRKHEVVGRLSIGLGFGRERFVKGPGGKVKRIHQNSKKLGEGDSGEGRPLSNGNQRTGGS